MALHPHLPGIRVCGASGRWQDPRPPPVPPTRAALLPASPRGRQHPAPARTPSAPWRRPGLPLGPLHSGHTRSPQAPGRAGRTGLRRGGRDSGASRPPPPTPGPPCLLPPWAPRPPRSRARGLPASPPPPPPRASLPPTAGSRGSSARPWRSRATSCWGPCESAESENCSLKRQKSPLTSPAPHILRQEAPPPRGRAGTASHEGGLAFSPHPLSGKFCALLGGGALRRPLPSSWPRGVT